MKETLLVKHAVGGRTFIDTGRQPLAYRVEQEGDSFHIAVQAPMGRQIEELLEWKHELNVFLFREFADQPMKKIWFYVEGSSVQYDSGREQLTMTAKSCIEYVPDRFGG